MSKWWCSGRHMVDVATRDDGPEAVKPIHSRKYFSPLTGTKRGLSCWTQRTSRITWPTWLTRLWKNWTSWPTWTTWTTRSPCNIWLRWAFQCIWECTAMRPQWPVLPHLAPSLHTWIRLFPALLLPSTNFSWGWVGTESTKGTISIVRKFSLTSAMGALLREGYCCGCGWEEICRVKRGYLVSFAKSIKLSSWLI